MFAVETRLHQGVGEVVASRARMSALFLKATQRRAFALALFTGLATESGNAQPVRDTAEIVTSADGIRIAFEVHGQGGPALVFVHGWSCNRSYWREQLQPFSKQFKVVAVDLAGHGESGLGRTSWTIAAFGGDVAAVVEKLGLKRIILIGHSMGGDVIVEAARQLPGRVAGLIWVDTYKKLGTPRTSEQIQAFIEPFRTNFVDRTRSFVRGMFPPTADPSLVERVARGMSAAPPEVALGALESAFSFDRVVPPALQKLQLPVVAINPDTPPTDLISMKRFGVEVLLMPRVGHFLMMENPEGFNPLLRTAIDKIRR